MNGLKFSLMAVGMVAAGSVTATAHAEVLNVNFGRSSDGPLFDGNADYTGQGAYVDAGNDTWNNLLSGASAFPAGGPFTGLVYSDGSSATGVTVTLSGSGGSENRGTDPDTLELLYGFITANGPSDSVTISGLNATAYDVYVYSVKDNSTDAEFTVGGSSFTLTGDVADAFTEDENYHVFSAVVPTAGEIVIDWEETGSGGQFAQGPFNGFQLVAVPEPSSLALLGIGGLAMLQRRRH